MAKQVVESIVALTPELSAKFLAGTRKVKGGKEYVWAVPSINTAVCTRTSPAFDETKHADKMLVEELIDVIGEQAFALMVATSFKSVAVEASKAVPPTITKNDKGEQSIELDVENWIAACQKALSPDAHKSRGEKKKMQEELTIKLVMLSNMKDRSPEQEREFLQVAAQLGDMLGVGDEDDES